MKSVRKILRIVLLAIVVLIVGIVVVIHFFGNSLLKTGIETAASKTLTVPVNIDDMDFSILGAKVGFQGLVIDNPPGYKHEKLLKLGDARIAVSTGSLLKDTINIKEIKLDNVNVVLEQKGVTSNNLQDIINALPKSDEPEDKTKAGKKLHIDKLELTNIVVQAKLLPVPGKADTVTLKLDPIVMNDLGSDNKLDVGKLTGKILLAIATGVAKQGVGLLPEGLTNAMSTTLGITADVGKAAVEGGAKLIEGGTDAGKGIIKGVQSLFKPKEKE
ncbi:MAG: AsmA family protein [Sedimentisphaerales bacterium]|nr:AsmA family protein [Sedimentisphaerales bacterium]